MVTTLLLFLLLVLVLGTFIHTYLKKKQCLKMIIDRIPGPPTMSIFGNVLDFPRNPKEFWDRMRSYSKEYYPIFRMWGNNGPTVNLLCPEDIELILSNSKHTEKSNIYRYLQPWVGTGLLTSSGEKWHSRRKTITPAFHFNILQKFVKIFEEQANLLVDRLQSECNKPYTTIGPFITQCTLNIICETAMGTRLNSSGNNHSAYGKALHKLCQVIIHRISRPWLFYDTIYRLTSSFQTECKVIDVLHAFSTSVIKERKNYLSVMKSSTEDSPSQKKRLAMLDLLISAEDNGASIDDNGIREEVDTFILGGNDTSSSSLSFTLMLLACYQDVQDNVVQELSDVVGNSDCPLTYQDLQNLGYLERVLKESLRMYPSIPMIARIAGEDVTTHTGYSIPAGCCVNVHIYDLHHNPEIYPDPYTFDPDRFLPEHTQRRHPYAYLPFSAGPRNCIGQKFALLEFKSIIATILRKYVLEPVDTPPGIILYADLVLRATGGIKIKIRPRLQQSV